MALILFLLESLIHSLDLFVKLYLYIEPQKLTYDEAKAQTLNGHRAGHFF